MVPFKPTVKTSTTELLFDKALGKRAMIGPWLGPLQSTQSQIQYN